VGFADASPHAPVHPPPPPSGHAAPTSTTGGTATPPGSWLTGFPGRLFGGGRAQARRQDADVPVLNTSSASSARAEDGRAAVTATNGHEGSPTIIMGGQGPQWLVPGSAQQPSNLGDDVTVTMSREEYERLIALSAGSTLVPAGAHASAAPAGGISGSHPFQDSPPAPLVQQHDTPSSARGPALHDIDLDAPQAKSQDLSFANLANLTRHKTGAVPSSGDKDSLLHISRMLKNYATPPDDSSLANNDQRQAFMKSFYSRKSRETTASTEFSKLVAKEASSIPRLPKLEDDHSAHIPDFALRHEVPPGCFNTGAIFLVLHASVRSVLHALVKALAIDGIILEKYLNSVPQLRMNSTATTSDLQYNTIIGAVHRDASRYHEAVKNCLGALKVSLSTNYPSIVASLETSYSHLNHEGQLHVLVLQIAERVGHTGWEARKGLLLYLPLIAQHVPAETGQRFTQWTAYWEEVITFFVNLDLQWTDAMHHSGIGRTLRNALVILHKNNDIVVKMLVSDDKTILLNEDPLRFMELINAASLLELSLDLDDVGGASPLLDDAEDADDTSDTAEVRLEGEYGHQDDISCRNCGMPGHYQDNCPEVRQQLAMLSAKLADLTKSLTPLAATPAAPSATHNPAPAPAAAATSTLPASTPNTKSAMFTHGTPTGMSLLAMRH
jgi:hypothetical protein